ncbi:MAG: autotransporter-associated beta strand repeat-containing protein, partial [Kiritimatiellae bacterium]|nr:autotransporter-associated beta strand repeat-containing protein [Kiritimatiellia bacterium]
VVSPGWGYTSAPTATIKTADRATDIACAVTMTDGDEQPGGGLTLTNSSATAGTFTLSSANTYTGPTVVAGGTLKLGAADAIPSANEVRLAGGTFDAGSFTPSYARVGGYGTLKGNVTVTDKLVFDAAQPLTPGLTVNGSLTVANGVTVEIANTNFLARGTTYTLATLPEAFSSTPASNLTKPWCVFLTNGGRTLKMCYQEGTMFLVK